jgi:organic radical activating enzyme
MVVKAAPCEDLTIQGEGSSGSSMVYPLGGCDVAQTGDRVIWIWVSSHRTDRLEHAVNSGTKSVVVTGGEPLMWDLDYLCSGLRQNNIGTFIETSGAYLLSGKWDWICLSPKKNMPPVGTICKEADELKVIIESKDDFKWAENYRKKADRSCKLFLQPEWSRFEIIIPEIVAYVKKNPYWRISIQAHKYMHIP